MPIVTFKQHSTNNSSKQQQQQKTSISIISTSINTNQRNSEQYEQNVGDLKKVSMNLCPRTTKILGCLTAQRRTATPYKSSVSSSSSALVVVTDIGGATNKTLLTTYSQFPSNQPSLGLIQVWQSPQKTNLWHFLCQEQFSADYRMYFI